MNFALVCIAVYCALRRVFGGSDLPGPSVDVHCKEKRKIGDHHLQRDLWRRAHYQSVQRQRHGSGDQPVSDRLCHRGRLPAGHDLLPRRQSVLPCIITHAAINTLGTFANDTGLTAQMRLVHVAALISVTVVYALVLTRTLPKRSPENESETDTQT